MSSATVRTGSTLTGHGSFVDPGADTWTATVNYGDGGGAAALTLNGKSFALSHVYAAAGTYTVSVTVTDDDGGVGSDTLTVTVNGSSTNVAPTVSAGPAATINEGDTFSSSGSFADPDNDTWTATVDYGDGGGPQSLTLNGKDFSLSHTYADDGKYTVSVTVQDDHEHTGSATTTVTVNNVDPYNVSLTLASATIDEGQSASLSGSFVDPGALDGHTVTINWGDGNSDQPFTLAAGTLSFGGRTHQYVHAAPNGYYTITAAVADEHGSGSGSIEVTVNNVAPTVTITGAPSHDDEGTAISLGSDVTDPDGPFTYDWQATASNGQVIADGSDDSFDFTPDDNGTYEVTLTVTDTYGESGTDSKTITVDNVAPNPSVNGDDTVTQGSTYTLYVSIADPGKDTVTTVGINWGDGTTGAITPNPAPTTWDSVPFTHVYWKTGPMTITISSLTDEDGSYTVSATKSITVNPLTLDSLTVADNPDFVGNVVTAAGTEVAELYVPEDADGGATVYLEAAFPSGADDHVLWSLNSGPAEPFSDGLSIRLDSSDGVDFTIQAGVDLDDDGALDSNEITRTVQVYIANLDLTAYRTGGYWGQAIDDAVESGGDPNNYIVLVNDDYEQNSPLGDDLTASEVSIPTSTTLPLPDNQDDDLIKLVLHRPSSSMEHGVLGLWFSNGAVLRVFNDQGVQIYDGEQVIGTVALSVDLDAPTGPLSGLMTGDVTLYAEAKQTSPNLSIAYRYWPDGAMSGDSLVQDDVHMRVADIEFTGASCDGIPATELVDRQQLLDLASGQMLDPAPLPDGAAYKILWGGIPTELSDGLSVESDLGDSYVDAVTPVSGDAMQSTQFGVMYTTIDPDSPLSASQQNDVEGALDLHALHGRALFAVLDDGADKQQRELTARGFYMLQADAAVQGYPGVGADGVQRLIYDSNVPIKFRFGFKDLPAGTKVEWDLDGSGFGAAPCDKDRGADPFSLTYSTRQAGPDNVNLPADPAHRRQTYTVRVRVSAPGKEPLVVARTLRVALEPQKVLNDLPPFVPGGAQPNMDALNAWLKTQYSFALMSGIPWQDPDKLSPLGRQSADVILQGGQAGEALLKDQRLVMGIVDPGPGFPISAVTVMERGERQGARYPNAVTAGTIIVGLPAFGFDQPELDYVIEHERNQIRSIAGFRDGTALDCIVSIGYKDANGGAFKPEVAVLAEQKWNQLLRQSEDFMRGAGDLAGGQVSWRFFQRPTSVFWSFYSYVVGGGVANWGSLRSINANLPAAVYNAAVNKIKAIRTAIPASWSDMLYIINPGAIYRFIDPVTEAKLPAAG